MQWLSFVLASLCAITAMANSPMKLPSTSTYAFRPAIALFALAASVLTLPHDVNATEYGDGKNDSMKTEPIDALIIGGGPGGLGVAAALARQRHSSHIFDSGEYRNERATHMHNILGWDGANPADYRAKSRTDLLQNYPELVLYSAEKVTQLETLDVDGTRVYSATTNHGGTHYGKKVVFAQGMTEQFPPIPGYDACWARGM